MAFSDLKHSTWTERTPKKRHEIKNLTISWQIEFCVMCTAKMFFLNGFLDSKCSFCWMPLLLLFCATCFIDGVHGERVFIIDIAKKKIMFMSPICFFFFIFFYDSTHIDVCVNNEKPNLLVYVVYVSISFGNHVKSPMWKWLSSIHKQNPTKKKWCANV